ncbi:hypothetical protein [Clostridium estertheticum]|uniref:hypothetical protein n=1 Tax=Clostridium estertheticum TaxID=238834 RepID=UPI001C0E8B9C|nr:hypothetical protein [Clostridium estertheticum]MBU3173304.1 hypothetical protein [Clostridium estertheticum]
MFKKLSIILMMFFLIPILMGAGMSDTNLNLPPVANMGVNYYQPKFITILIVSNTSANTTDITTQLQSLQLSMKSQNVTLEYQILTSAALATNLPQNLINYRCYADKYFLYYPGDTTCLTPKIQNFLYTEGFNMQALCSLTQYASINSNGFFSGNGGGGYFATSLEFKNYIQTKEENPLIPATTQGTLYNPTMNNTSSFIPSCTIKDPQNSNITVTYNIKDSNNAIKFTGTQNITNTLSLQTITFPRISLIGLNTGKYTITFNTYSNPAVMPVTSDIKYTTTTNTFYNVHGSTNLVTDYMEKYNMTSSDPANYNIMANRWMFNHDNNLFTPNQGTVTGNGTYMHNPIQLNKSGDYKITYAAQSQPITQSDFPDTYNLFNNFNLWSIQTDQFSSIVVNRPISLATATLTKTDISHYSLALTDTSYAFDHQNDVGKGIALVNYKWKQQETLPWKVGLPQTIQSGLVYEVQIQALSVDGIWGFPYQLFIGAKNPPIAQFSITNNPMNQGDNNTITDTSYSPNVGGSITLRNWYVLDTSYNIIKNCGTTQPDFKSLLSGEYIIEEIVKDDGGLVSIPCYRNLSVKNPLTITASVLPNPSRQGQTVTFNINTTGYADLLTIDLADELKPLDKIITLGYFTKSITPIASSSDSMNYVVPLNTPLTIDAKGVKLREPYKFKVTAVNGNGDTISTVVSLDVTGNIFDGIKTQMK